MVSNVYLVYNSRNNVRLSDKAKNVQIKQLDGSPSTEYQIANIYNPKVKFLFVNAEQSGLYYTRIRKMEE